MKSFFKKIIIFKFFKTKKFFILAFVFLLFFLFTPISLHQVGTRIEDYINNKAKAGVKQFEAQTGLQINWEFLKFNIFNLTVKLEGVRVKSPELQKIQELKYLDGLQTLSEISARPSLYSLLFDKKIVLAKLKIEKGDIYLKTLKTAFKKRKNIDKDLELPIKKLLITKTNINLSHKDYKIKFLDLASRTVQKKGQAFYFDFFVKAFYINKSEGFKGFSGLKQTQVKTKKEEVKKSYELSFKGSLKSNKVSFKTIQFKNQDFKSLTEWLDIDFDSKGVRKLDVRSKGALPLSLIQTGVDLMEKDVFFSGSLLSYNLNIQYQRAKGYQGFFDLKGGETVFRSTPLKSFSLKGTLKNYLVAIEKAFIETQGQGQVNIKKGELFFKQPYKMSFMAEVKGLSSNFVAQDILDLKSFPVKGDITGPISCEGFLQDFKCSIKSKSQRIKIEVEEEILSFYGMNVNFDLNFKNQILDFLVRAQKTDLLNTKKELRPYNQEIQQTGAEVFIKGQYVIPLDYLKISYSFIGDLNKDLKFNTPFGLSGRVLVNNGEITLNKGELKVLGDLKSRFLKIQSYRLENIVSSYKMEGLNLTFFNFKGSPGNMNYTAYCDIDFKNKILNLKINSPFVDLKSLATAFKDKIKTPVKLKGTGNLSFLINYPWEEELTHAKQLQKKIELKADFFNVSIDKDFFQQVVLDIGLKNNEGIVRSLLFKRRQGFIKGSGVFDNDYVLNLDVLGQNLSLERLEWLNNILPFNQSGDVNFKMKVAGLVTDPIITSQVFISNMFFYSYPVENSNIKLNISKQALSFSGRLMNEIVIDQFIYPFTNNKTPNSQSIKISGRFYDLDFVRMLFSKNRLEKTLDYFSKIKGSFLFSKGYFKDSVWEGQVKIDDFFVSKSNKWIKSNQGFSVFFDKTKWFLTDVVFTGQDDKTLSLKKSKEKMLLSGEVSLGLFSVFFPFLDKFEGFVKGQLSMNNNLKKAQPKGSLQIEGGLFSVPAFPEFTNVKASVIFLKNNVFINNFKSVTGGGTVQGEGSLFYNFYNPPRLSLNLEFLDTSLNIPEDFNTRGSGKIQITGEAPPYLIKGWYEIESGMITKDFSGSSKTSNYDFSFLKQETEKKDSLFKLDLNVKTKQSISVLSSFIRSSAEGAVDIYGDLDSLLIKGRFDLSQTGGENLIFFRGQEFKISSGSVLFNHSPPDNPFLNINASTVFTERVIDPLVSEKEVEKQYKIFLSLKGSSKNPDFLLNSRPALNEKEIISLLTLGIGARRFDANVSQNVTDYSYQILGSLLLEKPLNKEIKEALGVDFRLTPYINALNEPVTKITFSKNWFEKWKTSYSRTIEDAQSDNIKLKYNLNTRASLTAFWENEGLIKDLDSNREDRFGLDFEFNFDF